MIRTLAVAAGLAGAILLAPVAQAQPDSIIGPAHPNTGANGAAVARTGHKLNPTIRATPFGSRSTFANQPGLAAANGAVPVPTGTRFGYHAPMQNGNLVGPANTIKSFSGIRTRHGRAAGTSQPAPSGGLFG